MTGARQLAPFFYSGYGLWVRIRKTANGKPGGWGDFQLSAHPEFREVVDDSDQGRRQLTATGTGGGVR